MKTPRPWIAYVGPMPFPEGGASARRILGNAKALVAAGYDVVIVSGQRPDAQGSAFEVAPGIRCMSVNERDAEFLPRPVRRARYALMGTRSWRWIDTQPIPPAAVILYSGYSPYLLQFIGWGRRSRVPVLFDAVEWYSAPSLLEFLVSPYLWNTEFAMRALIPRLDGVIAISRALETYYSSRGLPVARVPPLFDRTELAPARPADDPEGLLRLAYAGSPGKKDLLDEMIEAVIVCDAGSGRIVLNIVGLSESELRSRAPLRRRGGRIPDCLRAQGRVSHARSTEIVGQADFSVFLRHLNRVSTNGFPTKFVESLALGTPVISNITSDLADYLRDGETGIVCPAPTQEALEHTLKRAMATPPHERTSLRSTARAEAERNFGYQGYVEVLGDLIDKSRQRMIAKVS